MKVVEVTTTDKKTRYYLADDTDAPAPKRKDTLLSGLILKLFTNVLASITFMLSSYPYFTQ